MLLKESPEAIALIEHCLEHSEQYHWTTYLLTIQCPAKPVAFVFGGTTVVPDDAKVVGASLHEWYGVRGHCKTPQKRVVWIPWAMGALSI